MDKYSSLCKNITMMKIVLTCYLARFSCRCQLPLDNVILGSGWMLRKVIHWIDWWQYHRSPPWSWPSLCLSRTVLVVLPKDNWSSITSSNSWWNCISFFSSPNLPNHVTPVSKYSDELLLVRKVELEPRLQSRLLRLFSHLLGIADKKNLQMSGGRSYSYSTKDSNSSWKR